MEDQFRDTCVKRQNKDRGIEDPIRVSFYDKDKELVNEITRKEARCIASLNPSQSFFFQDGDGYQRELKIGDVNSLGKKDQLGSAPPCPTNPQVCGPPKVEFFGGNGIGAMANVVVSPNSSSVIGFDFKSRGFNFDSTPIAQIIDDCGNGSGSSTLVQMQSYGTSTSQINLGTTGATGGTTGATGGTTGSTGGTTGATGGTTGDTGGTTGTTGGTTGATGGRPIRPEVVPFNPFSLSPENQRGGMEIKNIVIKAPGNGYLSAPDGSMGGNERVWKSPNDGYVKTKNGTFYIVTGNISPTNLQPGDTYYPPQSPSDIVSTLPPVPSVPTYPVVIDIEEVYVDDGGFGYQSGDTLEVVPSNGAKIEPVINNRGEIESVLIINSGIGFIDMPEIFIKSSTGYNAKLIPVLRITPLSEIPDPTIIPPGTQLISVVDCVGKNLPKSEFDIIPR